MRILRENLSRFMFHGSAYLSGPIASYKAAMNLANRYREGGLAINRGCDARERENSV